MTKSLTTDNNPCETNHSKYPDLMRGAAIASEMTAQGCITPYVKGQKATCKTEEKSTKIFMGKYTNDEFSYLMPCKLWKTKVLLESFWSSEESKENQTIILKLPSNIIHTETAFSYSFLSFMAEFGSWLGLFTGLAVIQVFCHYYFTITY